MAQKQIEESIEILEKEWEIDSVFTWILHCVQLDSRFRGNDERKKLLFLSLCK